MLLTLIIVEGDSIDKYLLQIILDSKIRLLLIIAFYK